MTEVELIFKKVVNIDNGVSIFSFIVKPDNFSYKAGQYMNLGMWYQGETVFRPFSIASVKDFQTTIDFVIPFRVDGLFSKYVYNLKPGDIIKAQGPFGSMILEEVDAEVIYFLSTGTGIIPFRSMLVKIKEILKQHKIIHFYTQQNNTLVPFYDEFVSVANSFPNFMFKVFCIDSDQSLQGPYHIKDSILNYIKRVEFKNTDSLFASGNPEFIRLLKSDLTSLEGKPNKIFTDL